VVYPYKHYTLMVPPGWNFSSNLVNAGDVTVDGVFAPDEIAGVKPNVGVLTELLLEGEAPTLDGVLEQKLEVISSISDGTHVISDATVAGRPGRSVSYRADDPAREVTEYYVITETAVYVLQLVAPAGNFESFAPQLNAIRDSFEVTE
jgi:hypothetical protein